MFDLNELPELELQAVEDDRETDKGTIDVQAEEKEEGEFDEDGDVGEAVRRVETGFFSSGEMIICGVGEEDGDGGARGGEANRRGRGAGHGAIDSSPSVELTRLRLDAPNSSVNFGSSNSLGKLSIHVGSEWENRSLNARDFATDGSYPKLGSTSDTICGSGIFSVPAILGQGKYPPVQDHSRCTSTLMMEKSSIAQLPQPRLLGSIPEDPSDIYISSSPTSLLSKVSKGKRARDDFQGVSSPADHSSMKVRRCSRSNEADAAVGGADSSLISNQVQSEGPLKSSEYKPIVKVCNAETYIYESETTNVRRKGLIAVEKVECVIDCKQVFNTEASSKLRTDTHLLNGKVKTEGREVSVVKTETPAAAGEWKGSSPVLSPSTRRLPSSMIAKSFWQGQLCGEGFCSTDVVACCPEDIKSSSKLRVMPQVLKVERLISTEEFFEVVKQYDLDEPVISVKLRPGSTSTNIKFTSCAAWSERDGEIEATLTNDFCADELDLQLAWKNLLRAFAKMRLVAVVSLQPDNIGGSSGAELYLLSPSSLEADVGLTDMFDKDFVKRIVDGDDLLLGISIFHDENREFRVQSSLAESSAACAIHIQPQVSRTSSVLDTKLVQNKSSDSVDILDTKLEECSAQEMCKVDPPLPGDESCVQNSTITPKDVRRDSPRLSGVKELKEFSSFNVHQSNRHSDKARGKKDAYTVRPAANHVKDEYLRSRAKDWDKDNSRRDREATDSRTNLNRDGPRFYQRQDYRHIERTKDVFNGGRSKDKHLERLDRSTRDRDWHPEGRTGVGDRSKPVRERTKEPVKDKLREQGDIERFGRTRSVLADAGALKTDQRKYVREHEKNVHNSAEHDQGQVGSQFGKENKKRRRFTDGNTAENCIGGQRKIRSLLAEFASEQGKTAEFEMKVVAGSENSAIDIPSQGSLDSAKADRAFASDSLIVCQDFEGTEQAKLENIAEKVENVDLGGKLLRDRDVILASETPALIRLAESVAVAVDRVFGGSSKEIEHGSAEAVCSKGWKVLEAAEERRLFASMDDDTERTGADGHYALDTKLSKHQDDMYGFSSEHKQGVLQLPLLAPSPEEPSVEPVVPVAVIVAQGGKEATESSPRKLLSASSPGSRVVLSTEDNVANENSKEHMQESPAREGFHLVASGLSGNDSFCTGITDEDIRQNAAETIITVDRRSLESSQRIAASPVETEARTYSSPDAKEVGCDLVLESCDKETRAWLVSKQNASYLQEEFGVHITRLEEVASVNYVGKGKSRQGSISVKISLSTSGVCDSSEAKWFVHQAADVLRAVVSRGVFAKCLWYQGPVSREAGDQAPSIQAVVKRIKGEDGKSLERIQDATGVMIGVVLDASKSKVAVNSGRVIGLRLKCTRKKGIVEATTQVDHLLSLVAKQISEEHAARKCTMPQESGLLKLKVDCYSNSSPSYGVPTPAHKDVVPLYSPTSPAESSSPLRSFRSKLEDPFCEEAPSFKTKDNLIPPSSIPVGSLANFITNKTSTEELDVGMCPRICEDDDATKWPDPKPGLTHPLYVSNFAAYPSPQLLKDFFEDILKEKFGFPPGFDRVSDLVSDVRLIPEKNCASVQFASEDLLICVLKLYAKDKELLCGLKFDLSSTRSMKVARQYSSGKFDTQGTLGGLAGVADPALIEMSRCDRKNRKNADNAAQILHNSSDSNNENRFSKYSTREAHLHHAKKPKPLFLTELMRNASAHSLHKLFEDIIKKYINHSVASYKGRNTVLDVRYIPSRGCAFVDLATPELVDFMLDLHVRRPEVFCHMKLEVGRKPVPLGQVGEEIYRRSTHLSREFFLEEPLSYGFSRKSRRYFASMSPTRKTGLHNAGAEFVEENEEDEERGWQQNNIRKRRSDPERTVYVDRLPESASEGMIRRIFERVVREHMTEEQREVLGEHTITEVRYVPTKFCAFVVFVAEELTRLVLRLYNQNEDIFENMRLKPHFHSKMEDMCREDLHDRDEVAHRLPTKDSSLDRRLCRREIEEFHEVFQSSVELKELERSRSIPVHRTLASTAFKEVDRRRSVYVDRIPDWLSDSTMRDVFERNLRHSRHGYGHHMVSHVCFFRDKFDPDQLCAFVEVENEEVVQELLEAYMDGEEAFLGMRVRPASKFIHEGH